MNTIMSLTLLLVLSVYGTRGLSCDCEQSVCESTESLKRQCKGGLVHDVCLCCKTCAKVEGEFCGGLWNLRGICDQGLSCDRGSTSVYMMGRGKCVSISQRKITTTTTPSAKVTKFPRRWQRILKTTDMAVVSSFSSGDESIDEHDRIWGIISRKDNSQKYLLETELSTETISADTEQTEWPTTDLNEFPRRWQRILKTTDMAVVSSFSSGDESIDEHDRIISREDNPQKYSLETELSTETISADTEQTEWPTTELNEVSKELQIRPCLPLETESSTETITPDTQTTELPTTDLNEVPTEQQVMV